MMQEILNWMCEYMTFWYVDYGDYKEVLYPITKEKQDKVLSILDMRSDSLIYNNNFYSLSKDIIMTTDKASYTYYLKKSSYFFCFLITSYFLFDKEYIFEALL